ncbi:MAG: hypothetical protein WBI14_09435 [Anaerolineaceae bacterium]
MKRTLPLMVAILAGVFVLVALSFPVSLGGFLNIVLNWAIIVGAVALLVAIAHLFLAQWRRIMRGNRGSFYSLIFVVVFLLSLVGGIWMGVDNANYRLWVASIQKPLEISLLGLLALVMTSAAVQFFRTRGWSPLTLAFGISALLFLVIGLGVLQALKIPQLTIVLNVIQQLPLIGARGLLIGMGFGALLLGLRVLFGQQRPWGD